LLKQTEILKIGEKMKKKWNYIVFPSLTLIASLFAYAIYRWLISIHANFTLKSVVPATFFIASFFGLWLAYNFIKLLLFQRRGIRGYKLRGKITSYFLLSTLSFILVFASLMFFLIFLIENTFIDRERKIADGLLDNNRNMIWSQKKKYESEILLETARNPSYFSVIFKIDNKNLIFITNDSFILSKSLIASKNNIINFYSTKKGNIFYTGDLYNITIVKRNNIYYAAYTENILTESYQSLNNYLDSLNKLRQTKKYIFPVSILSILTLAVPILIGVFFVSLRVAKNITVPIEEIAKGISIIAERNLDYKVRIKAQDEIGDLAYHFNTMATKLKFAYQQIKRMERIEAWQEMARRLAHEVKNPLTPIKLSTERLLYAYEFKPKEFGEILQKTTSTIINETKRLEKLVNEFSQFARLPIVKLEKRNIAVTLNELIDFFQGAYPQFQIIKNISFNKLYMNYDESHLKQVIINLVNNAIEACENTEKYVEIKAEKNEDNLILSIYDKGCGISTEIQDKIFEPYFTTKKQGSGIGLAIAERIVSEHNGNIWFESRDDGTTFFIQIPIRDVTQEKLSENGDKKGVYREI
jgi:signal transduction histidine kinase